MPRPCGMCRAIATHVAPLFADGLGDRLLKPVDWLL